MNESNVEPNVEPNVDSIAVSDQLSAHLSRVTINESVGDCDENDVKSNETDLKSNELDDNVAKKAVPTDSKCKYRNVESRYKQSTSDWVHKKLDDSLGNRAAGVTNKSRSATAKKANSSKNPTPDCKSKVKKSSTPLTSSKPLNCSAVSAITGVCDEESVQIAKMGAKYANPLTTARSVPSKAKLNFNSQTEDKGTSARVGLPFMAINPDLENKNKELEKLIIKSRYIQSRYIYLNACEMNKKLDEESMSKVVGIWEHNNDLRQQLLALKSDNKSLKKTINYVKAFECLRQFLVNYFEVRDKLDPIYNSFAQLISKQKMFIKLSGDEVQHLNDLLECRSLLSETKEQMKLFEHLAHASSNIQNFANIKKNIEEIKMEFNNLMQEFDSLIETKTRYEKTKKSLESKVI